VTFAILNTFPRTVVLSETNLKSSRQSATVIRRFTRPVTLQDGQSRRIPFVIATHGTISHFHAHERLAEAEIRTWLELPDTDLVHRAIHGGEFDHRWEGANAAFLAVRLPPAPADIPLWLRSNPWIYEKIPNIIPSRCAVVRWWIWHANQPGFLEGKWHPNLSIGARWSVEEIIGPGRNAKDIDAHFKRLRRLAIKPLRPGPEEEYAATFTTEKEWHDAIREKVLVMNNTRFTASAYVIAEEWLGISHGTLWNYINRSDWTPNTLDELREGKF
jgi:hypothetical protein